MQQSEWLNLAWSQCSAPWQHNRSHRHLAQTLRTEVYQHLDTITISLSRLAALIASINANYESPIQYL